MDLGLKGKVALITGGGDGIGRRTVLTFAEEGVKVAVNDMVPSKAEAVASEALALGAEALPVIADVSNWDQVIEMVSKVIARFGHIDVLVNNAFASDRKSFTQSSREDWQKPIDVCLYGTLNCTRAVIEHMVKQRYGKVVNVISDAARVGEAIYPVYGAAKAGILALSKGIAKEVGRYNINVNCVAPGATNTARILRRREEELAAAKTEEEREKIRDRQQRMLKAYPLGRFGEPEDIANMIVFLATERARHVTGQAISVDGGYCMVS